MTHRVVETHTIRKSQDNRSHPYINQYELISVLGEGMHGKVMLAQDTASPTKDKVAIKVMRRVDPHNRRLPRSSRPDMPPPTAQQETESKIRREIAIMKKCTHQNLVRLLEVIDDPASKKVYLVMENLAGGEVKWRSRDHSEPVLELSQIQRIMRDVTLGLEYLHHQGIIHRDIKPANLLWTEDRQSVKICDFGVSHFAGPSDLNEVGMSKTAGSPAFFAPELCSIPNISFDEESPPSSFSPKTLMPSTPLSLNIPPITKQIDIWALGVTLYCLLFAKPPWQGQTEYQMFRAICSEDFEVPDTMARDRIPTGGRDRKLEGREIGWCIMSVLEGLLEKDQEKRLSLADVKKISWVQNGVREPEKWLRETAPNKQNRVVITDEDTQSAIKQAKFSYYPLFFARVAKMANKIKRVPLHLSKSSAVNTNDALLQTSPNLLPGRPQERGSSGSRNPTPSPNFRRPSLSKASSSRNRDTPDRKTKRFTFGPSVAPSTAGQDDRRRNSTVGFLEGHNPPSNEESQGRLQLSSTSRAWRRRRQSDSLQTPTSSNRNLSFFKGNSSLSLSNQTYGLNESQRPVAPTAKGNLKQKLSRVMRSSSVRRKAPVDRPATDELSKRIGLDVQRQSSRGRTSAETLDVLRSREVETLGLTHAMRASSWGSPRDPEDHMDNDTRLSFDPSSSETNDQGIGIQDFNKSVVQLGAGGYVDSPSSGNSNEFLSDNSQSISPNSDSSISSESTTRQCEPRHYPPRVTSPLARPHAAALENEDYSSEVFEDTGPEDGNSSDEDVIEVKTRRPSTVLHRSTNASPLR